MGTAQEDNPGVLILGQTSYLSDLIVDKTAPSTIGGLVEAMPMPHSCCGFLGHREVISLTMKEMKEIIRLTNRIFLVIMALSEVDQISHTI